MRQDQAYSIDIVHKLLEMYEDEYQDATTAMSLNSICACMFLLLTCLGGMRGYKAMWTDLPGLRYDSWKISLQSRGLLWAASIVMQVEQGAT